MIMDSGHHHHHNSMPHPFIRAQDQQYHHNNTNTSNGSAANINSSSSSSSSSRRGGDVPHVTTPPLGPNHFHGQGPLPSGWIENHAAGTRGQQQQQQQQQQHRSIASTVSNNNNPVPRRSPRGNPAPFRFENNFPTPPHHSNMHSRHINVNGVAAPASAAGGGGGAPPHLPVSSKHQQQPNHRGVPSPHGGPVGPASGARGIPPPMRLMPPNVAGGGGLHRRPEHHMVGPLGDPMFVGSPGAPGSGMGLGVGVEGNLGMETVSKVLIPNCKIGAVIGKGGAIIKHIREVSGAKVTISDSCTGLHDDSDDRMVTAAGTFNSVQLAFTLILSHAGAVGPDADPVMGFAGGDPDCVANSFRLLIPNVKAGGLIGRGGCTIKAIREQSGARIEISSQAFHFHPVHGPLPAPAHSSPDSRGGGQQPSSLHTGGPPSGGGDGGPRGGGGVHGGVNGGFGPGGGGGGGGGGGPPVNIPLPPPILMDRVMTAIGSFDACRRAHHLVASKLMDVRPSPVPMPSGPPPPPPTSCHGPPAHSQSSPAMIPTSSSTSSASAAAAAAAFAGATARGIGHRHGDSVVAGGCGPPQGIMPRGGSGGGGTHPHLHLQQQSQHPPHPHSHQMIPFNRHDESSRGGGGAARATGSSKLATASTSPASSVSEPSSSYHRQPWDFEDHRSWGSAAAAIASSSPPLPHAGPPMPPAAAAAICGELLSREGSGGRGNSTSTPRLSSSVSVSRGSPRGSAGSVEDFGGSVTAVADSNASGGGGVDHPILTRGRSSSSSGVGGGGAAVAVMDSGGGARSGGGDDGIPHQGEVLGNSHMNGTGNGEGAGDEGDLPACLVGIADLFGSSKSGVGNSNSNNTAPPPRSPSTITGIDVEVGRSAFANLGVGGLADIKHISGAGIMAAESPERYCRLDKVVAVFDAVLRGNAPADGYGLAAASAANAAAAAAMSSSSVSKVASSAGITGGGGRGGAVLSRSSSSSLSSPSSPFEGLSKKDAGGSIVGGSVGGVATTTPAAIAAAADGISRLSLNNNNGVGAGNVSTSSLATPGTLAAHSGGLAVGSGGGGGGGGAVGPNALKTVRITGTAEEVQLAEYLIRVRTAGHNVAAA